MPVAHGLGRPIRPRPFREPLRRRQRGRLSRRGHRPPARAVAEDADVMVEKIARQAEVLARGRTAPPLRRRQPGPARSELLRARPRAWPPCSARVPTPPGRTSPRAWTRRAPTSPTAWPRGPLATHYFGHGRRGLLGRRAPLRRGRGRSSRNRRPRDAALRLDLREPELPLRNRGRRWERRCCWRRRAAPWPRSAPPASPTPGPGGSLRAALPAPPAPACSLGEALRRAKAETLRLDPSARGVVEGWSLLGDPALTLPVEGARQ